MNNRKIIFVTVALAILLIAFGTLKTSNVNNFPVPITALVKTTYSDDSIDYHFLGINRLYLKHVSLYGWKQVDQMGSLRVFEKNGVRVEVITYKNGFNLTGGSSRSQP